ncbi:histidine kinase,histidine kinase,GAF domain-containing protein [Xenococcus sp. PCC 7305]|uniref:ATP-binding protein n=1 Tax=Xenococcus sp. PCC 7305 TaxID=102125 RepID=UPI0002AC33B1|nr:ATP-binding protein [Xenococcus sp. PCC 7305]ELS00478.1 histidine kinase,histidine kinase,GAF domain-containing protein [Xenococcus sp. PCC 7305]
MTKNQSLFKHLVTAYSHLRPQMYFKSPLMALCRAMEDLVLAGDDAPLIIANFRLGQFFRPEMRRYQRISQITDQIYIFVDSTQQSDIEDTTEKQSNYRAIALGATDIAIEERHLVIVGQQYTACVIGREQGENDDFIDQGKRFEAFWTFERNICHAAAKWLLDKIAVAHPELTENLRQTRELYNLSLKTPTRKFLLATQSVDLEIFTQRLVTYLQAGQYKLFKAYQVIATAERKERLINSISSALRSSLDPQEVLQITVNELGKLFPHCRCLLYRLKEQDSSVTIECESAAPEMTSLVGEKWLLSNNPLFVAAQATNGALAINNAESNVYIKKNEFLQAKISQAQIRSWLLIPIRYQDNLLGMLEIHYGGVAEHKWQAADIALVEAVSTNVGVAIAQASAYTDLVELNHQLEIIERIQSNLIAIVGHELRTPLSTIRIFLESLAEEPEMPVAIRTAMLNTALGDTERLRQLIQDFITLSKLETGNVYRRIEPLQLDYAIALAQRRIESIYQNAAKPEIEAKLPKNLPIISADAEGLVEVLVKLLDNACKFTPETGKVAIQAKINHPESNLSSEARTLEIVIADTGRGIEPSQLEKVFDRFSQTESYLRRSVSGVGLGLAICRQIIQNMGGTIWATSEGENQGSQFHFTIPVVLPEAK